MIVVTAFALFIQFGAQPAFLGALPDKVECDRLGTLLKGASTKTTYACLPYKMVIASPSGTSCTGSGGCLTPQ